MSELLETNQYVIVSQQDDFTMAETDVPSGSVPKSITDPKVDVSKSRGYRGFHLIRDPDGFESPKMLIVTTIGGGSYKLLMIGFDNPIFSQLFASPQKRTFLNFFGEWNGITPVTLRFNAHSDLVDSYYDSFSQMIYLKMFSPKFGRLSLEHAYLNNPFISNASSLVDISNYNEIQLGNRFDWQEDQYAGKFYYKEVVDGEVGLFEVPMRRFLHAFQGVESGKRVVWPFGKAKILGVSDGVFFILKNNKGDNGNTTIIWNSATGVQLEGGREGLSPQFEKFTIVKNNDFCMWRDGVNYKKSSCDEDREVYIKEDEGGLGAVAWLLIVCFILFTLIILLCVYIYWLRSSFVMEDGEYPPNEHETEASLFVSKQRSFAGSYADPALLDVSVDKWNQ